jgi:hypothetical protein
MQKLTLINNLEKQIEQEIIRLEQSEVIDREQERARLALYQQLVKNI